MDLTRHSVRTASVATDYSTLLMGPHTESTLTKKKLDLRKDLFICQGCRYSSRGAQNN